MDSAIVCSSLAPAPSGGTADVSVSARSPPTVVSTDRKKRVVEAAAAGPPRFCTVTPTENAAPLTAAAGGSPSADTT